LYFCLSFFLIELKGDAEKLKNFPPQKAVVDIEEKDAEDGLSESSAEEQDCKSSADGSPILEAYSGLYTCKYLHSMCEQGICSCYCWLHFTTDIHEH